MLWNRPNANPGLLPPAPPKNTEGLLQLHPLSFVHFWMMGPQDFLSEDKALFVFVVMTRLASLSVVVKGISQLH